MPIMALDGTLIEAFPYINLNDLNQDSLDILAVPCVWRGIGNKYNDLTCITQTFDFHLQKA